MAFSKIGRMVTALVATAALGLGMTACGGGTVGYMWVLGTYYNQISGFLIDNYTGNLTAIQHTPFASGGTNPVALVVKPGGRYVYVINSGAAPTTPGGTPSTSGIPGTDFLAKGSSISEFSVGSNGILTFEQNFSSQGVSPQWAAIDSSGGYLYVLDKYAPDYNDGTVPPPVGSTARATNLNGSITAFSIAGDTGRLTLVTNSTILQGGKPLNYFEVGPNPIMAKMGSSGCLYTLSPNSIFPYAVNSGNGQLTVPTTGPYLVTTANRLTSINTSGSGSNIFLTDAGANQIITLQPGGSVSCSLTQVSGGTLANVSGAFNPVNSVASSSGKFLYVLNQSNVGPQPNSNSSISAFTINSQGQLSMLADSTNNPYAVGSGPVCVAQDPTNQYLYISNGVDSTVTGKLIDQNRGYLSDLSRGSVFPVTKTPTCLAISGNI